MPAFFVLPERTAKTALHHEVLPIWEKWRESVSQPLRVICLDFHTDVLDCRRRGIADPVNAAEAVRVLRHDEHFDYALKYNMISKAFIISQTPAVTELPDDLQVFYNETFPEDEPLNSNLYRKYFDNALEDEYLAKFYKFLPHENYILDIDCDYFKTEKSLNPAKSEIFFELLCNAEMITISLESDWVRLLTFENPSFFTAEHIVEKLAEMYKICKNKPGK